MSYLFTKWQDGYLEAKPIRTSYLTLLALVIITVLTLPTPFTYMVF